MNAAELGRSVGRLRWYLALFGLFFVTGFLPLLGPPGYELNLFVGLVAAPIVGVATALEGRKSEDLFGATVHGAFIALRALFVVLFSAVLHGLGGGLCDGWAGLAFLLLASGFGLVLAGCISAGLGFLGRRCSRLVVAGAFGLGPSLSFAACFGAEFYFTPAVYGFSPFVGYFAGPLYDTVHFPFERLLSYRIAHILGLMSFWLAGVSYSSELVQKKARFTRGLALAAFLGMVTLSAKGEELGHRTTRTGLVRSLGATVSDGDCDVVFSAGLVPTSRARLLARECRAHLTELREFFGLSANSRRYTVFLFADVAEKGRYVGARSTYVAKPWRHEVYVNVEAFPHSVLRHELAHAVSADFGSGPMHVAGHLAGLIPDPGRIEGFAVAAAPRDEATGDLFEWARAERDLKRLPEIGRIFGLGFYGESSSRAYIAAGAFVAYVREKYGAAVLRSWYGGAELEGLTGQSWVNLERGFFTRLDREAPSPRLLQEAARKFSMPPVFERRCPQKVGRLTESFLAVCSGDSSKSRELEGEIFALDPGQKGLLVSKSDCLSGAGEFPAAELYLNRAESVAGDLFPWERGHLLHLLGDEAYRRHQEAEALANYESALKLATSDGEQRTIELKLWALGPRGRGVRERVFALLVPALPASPIPALLEWANAEPTEALPRYLLGRQFLQAGEPRRALDYLSLPLELPLPSLADEAARSALLAACELGEQKAVTEAQARGLERAKTPGQRQGIERFSAWCLR